MFFASYATDKDTLPHWRLGEVLLDETTASIAKASGIYRVRWWTQHYEDRLTRSIVDSRFWPDVYRTNTDRTRGKRDPIRPDRAVNIQATDVTKAWNSENFELAECIIVGPFFFTTMKKSDIQKAKKRLVSESYHIMNKIWQILERRGPLFKVSVDNIREAPTNDPPTTEHE